MLLCNLEQQTFSTKFKFNPLQKQNCDSFKNLSSYKNILFQANLTLSS